MGVVLEVKSGTLSAILRAAEEQLKADLVLHRAAGWVDLEANVQRSLHVCTQLIEETDSFSGTNYIADEDVTFIDTDGTLELKEIE